MSTKLAYAGAEHLIADAGHHGSSERQLGRQSQLVFGILAGSIFQIELIEHAAFVILGKDVPVGHTEGFALRYQAAQIALGRDFVGRHPAGFEPNVLTVLQGRLGNHPSQNNTQFIEVFDYRKEAGCLHVVSIFNIGQEESALGQPLPYRNALVGGFGQLQIALESIVKTVRAGYIGGFAHRNHIDTNAGGYIECPAIGWNTGDDILLVQRPRSRYAAVFDPHFGIVGGKRTLYLGILHEHGGMWLYFMVHDFALVDNLVLHVQCRGNKFAAGTVMIKLSTRKG